MYGGAQVTRVAFPLSTAFPHSALIRNTFLWLWCRNIVGVTMSMVIMFSYLVILAPAREHIENAMLRYDPSLFPLLLLAWCIL
jgi:hypothetical protein